MRFRVKARSVAVEGYEDLLEIQQLVPRELVGSATPRQVLSQASGVPARFAPVIDGAGPQAPLHDRPRLEATRVGRVDSRQSRYRWLRGDVG